MHVEPMTGTHLESVCDIHVSALQGDFLPSLGHRFLKVVYEGILELGLGFGFVALEQDRAVGFVLASLDSGSLFKKLIARRWPALSLWAGLALLRRPYLAPQVLETFLYPKKGEQAPYKSELISLAVREGNRGQRVGEALLKSLHEEFRLRGVDGYKVTVYKSNDGANRFYQKMGGQYALSFTHYGREWNLYTYELNA